MAQAALTIANGSGSAVRAAITAANLALGSTSKGPNAPSSDLAAGMQWVEDDSPSGTQWGWRMYDGADWITTGLIDSTNNRYMPVITYRLGIGTTTPSSDFHIYRSTGVQLEQKMENSAASAGWVLSSAGDTYLYASGANFLGFFTNSAERVRIVSTGEMLIGKNSVANDSEDGFLFNDAGFAKGIRGSDGSVWQFYRGGSVVGSITVTSSATTYNTSSDPRLKRDVRDMTEAEALEMLGDLRPRMGAYLVEASNAPLRPMFLAPEMQAVVPHAVTGEPNAVDGEGQPIMQAAQYDPQVPILVRALQSALAKIEALEARVAVLEGAP